ncbi:hypothetical protein GIB67_002012 [Kingdonia uniflora]|uniref:Uncharacterized protein n=1 Tax=Kingdonia uniflora TaxID=39325 RepID=A0A7J7MA22_9MAGN|nr:hypothetical protein GIB67_002012 [Kingdonia uniflora]
MASTNDGNVELNKKIIDLYSDPSFEDIWGTHMHHGFYDLNATTKPNVQAAQIRLIEEALRFANVPDALQLPFSDGQFGVVWSLECGDHLPDKMKGSRFFVATWNVSGKSPPCYLNLEDWFHTLPRVDIYVLGKLSGVSHSSSSKLDYAVQVILDNGLLQVTFAKPGEVVSVIKYNGIENLLDGHEKEDKRGYWDLEWSRIGQCGRYNHVVGTEFKQMRCQDIKPDSITFIGVLSAWGIVFGSLFGVLA